LIVESTKQGCDKQEWAMSAQDVQMYGVYRIESSAIPDRQFTFSDFGWAFQAFEGERLLFSLVVKTNGSDGTIEENRQALRKWGKQTVESRLDRADFVQGGYYCYRSQNFPYNGEPEEEDCDKFKTPLR
jgi:hypothetical protein